MYAEKLSGFLGIRADIKLRLQINAQPFQAGRLMLVWVPYARYRGGYVSILEDQTEPTMVSTSGYPRVDIDISSNTEVDFTIPYVSPQSHYNLVSGEGDYGFLYVFVYSPLRDSDKGAVDCTLWMNLERIDLAFPTGFPMTSKPIDPDGASREVFQDLTQHTISRDTFYYNLQVGNEEANAEKTRSLSVAFGKFSETINAIPDYVPLISEIRMPTIWASDTAASIAKFFGLSKYQSDNVPQYVKQTPTHFMANYDGVDMSHSLALAAENSLETMPDMVGNDIDEMTISHIVSTPCYYTHFTWKTTDANYTKLWSIDVSPLRFIQNETQKQTYIPTHLAYTSALFALWRGSIDFTFKFVKTKFHSGRVRIFFQPGPVSYSQPRQDFNYSQVVDLRSQTDVTFRVPFVTTRPWLRNIGFRAQYGGDIFTSPGLVYVEVLNELRAASTVSTDIDVLVEVSAGPDFELACPTNSMFLPVKYNAPQSINTTTTPLKRLGIKLQVGEEEAPVREVEQSNNINKDQLGSDPLRLSWWHNLNTVGEKVCSVRQLIKRAFPVAAFQVNAATPINVIRPFRFAPDASLPQDPALTEAPPGGYLEYFAHIYTFWRGGVNIKIMTNYPSDLNAAICTLSSNPSSYDQPNQIVMQLSSNEQSYIYPTSQFIYQNLEGMIDLSIPYYSQYHMIPISDLPDTHTNISLGLAPLSTLNVTGLSDKAKYLVYRNATDAYQFGYLVGTPRVTTIPQPPKPTSN